MAIGRLIRTLTRHAPRWRTTALAVVAAERDDPFRVLIACLLSLRTKDETTGPASARLFALADTPHAMLRLTPRQIERTIFPVGFYRTKARVILGVCRDLIDRFDGRVPDEIDALLTLKGVGRKTANLVVTQGFKKPGICLPRRYWIGYNDLLVAFGQNVCQPLSPKCSECPVSRGCPRLGVTHSR